MPIRLERHSDKGVMHLNICMTVKVLTRPL
jgi:hypothetical protein